ncbi:DUF2059 domain-containing protein [Phyllobacterium leguminum]|uniref:DUF2059 domain-containing protein n=1 Tax=Phyllobacterium leguminum TaxID=314237 RepID=A0A318T8W9_9HYPH|nr:DUF2059 domain-containing protein [Phyllobacterium leguminum]PYE89985.1 hypothetical protein C7477_10272 [Phyllobacterium leguminum]
MTQATGFRRLITPLAVLAIIAGLNAAQAQEISESHLAAARQAIAAIHATEQFDAILPRAAQALKAELIQKDPNLEAAITKTVDEKALALAARRADLETEAARAYAKSFSETDLKAIAAFYESAAGKKLISEGPIVTREVLRSANIWQNGIARDLAQSVGEAMSKQEGAAQPAPAEQPKP